MTEVTITGSSAGATVAPSPEQERIVALIKQPGLLPDDQREKLADAFGLDLDELEAEWEAENGGAAATEHEAERQTEIEAEEAYEPDTAEADEGIGEDDFQPMGSVTVAPPAAESEAAGAAVEVPMPEGPDEEISTGAPTPIRAVLTVQPDPSDPQTEEEPVTATIAEAPAAAGASIFDNPALLGGASVPSANGHGPAAVVPAPTEAAPGVVKVPQVVAAEKPVDVSEFIPKGQPNIVGMVDERKAVEIAIKMNKPLVLVGHTGIAKTTLIAKMHEEMGRPYRAITFNGAVEVDTIVGKWVATPHEGMVFRLGVLPFCMKHGISLCINEINFALPEVLVLLHEFVDEGFISLLDLDPDHPDFIVHPHPDFRLFGTMNPPEIYAGARDLSPALARRVLVKRVDELDEDKQAEVIKSRSGCAEDVAKGIAKVGMAIKESFEQGKTMYWFSVADGVMWGELVAKGGMSAFDAAELAVIGKASSDDVEFIRNAVRLQFDPNASRYSRGW